MQPVEVLETTELVRKRPGMYIGDIHDGSGLLHMVWELVANCLDQFLAGNATRIEVTLDADGAVLIEDDGPGIPVTPLRGRSFLEVAFTELHGTPTFDGHGPHEHVGLRGVGVMPVNALSERLHVRTYQEGRLYELEYRRGKPTSSLRDRGLEEGRGTRISFVPDAAIFTDTWIDAGAIGRRLRELAWLNPGVAITLRDRREQKFHEPRGLAGFFERFRLHSDAVCEPIALEGIHDSVTVEAIVQWCAYAWHHHVESFANSERTTGDGSHVDGFVAGIVSALRSTFPDLTRGKSAAKLREKVSPGLHAVVCVRLRAPEFAAPTRDRLASEAALVAVRTVVQQSLRELLATNPALREHFRRALTPIASTST